MLFGGRWLGCCVGLASRADAGGVIQILLHAYVDTGVVLDGTAAGCLNSCIHAPHAWGSDPIKVLQWPTLLGPVAFCCRGDAVQSSNLQCGTASDKLL